MWFATHLEVLTLHKAPHYRLQSKHTDPRTCYIFLPSHSRLLRSTDRCIYCRKPSIYGYLQPCKACEYRQPTKRSVCSAVLPLTAGEVSPACENSEESSRMFLWQNCAKGAHNLTERTGSGLRQPAASRKKKQADWSFLCQRLLAARMKVTATAGWLLGITVTEEVAGECQ